MFKTKSQVDRHVSNVLNQLRDPKERNVKGLAFASLYYKINEYDVALRYLQGFLTVKETYASAHKLLGQIYEAKKQPAKALDAYKRSLELDENQRDVLRKVCEMCVQVDVPPDISQYWVERANRSIRGDPIVLALKEKICSGGHDKSEGDEDDLEELLAQQLVKQPRDTSLRCRLVRHLLERGRVGEARKHVLEVEQTGVLVENLEWGRVVRQVLEECIERAGPGANTAALDQQRLLTCLCRLSSLSLRHGSMGESVRTIHEFDSAIERCQELRQVSESWNTLHMEMQAQLFYFIGTLLLKKAVSGDLRWDEARNLAGACYGVSVGVEPFTRRAAWYSRDGDERQKTYDTWRNLAIRRYVITGHMMSELSIGASWISSLQAEYLIPQVQQRLVKLVYTLPDMASTANQTYLSQTTLYTSVTLTLPSNITMTDMEKELANSEVSDLSLLVWLAVQHRHESAFHRLQYSYSHFAGLVIDGSELKHCSLQTLSQLDIQAFVSAVVWDSVAELELNSVDRSQPVVLPPEIAPPLCRKEQSDWWTAAYKLVNTSARVGEDWSLLQRTLQRGLDEMHLVGNHTMSLSLLVHLARSFQDTEEAGSEYSKLSEARSVFYWQAVLDMIVRVKKQKKMWIPKEWLFRPEPQLPLAERDSFIRQSELSGMTYLAEVDLRHGRLEAALERFSKVDTAEASYQQAKIYTTMAAEAPSGDDRDYLEQAREALCLTLDRLRGNQHNPLHYEVTELFDSVETRLNRSTLMRDPCESELSIRPGPEIPHSTPRSVRRTLYPVLTSPASRNPLPDLSAERAHVAASPDRIDAQLRALTVKHDGEMNEIRELVRSLTDKVEDLREEVAEVKELVKKVPQAPPPDPAPAPAPAPAPSGPPIIPPAPHQMGLPYYGYPMRDYDLLAPHAYPPGYAYAMPLPPQALAPLHHGYGAINAMGVRPPQHPAAAGLVPPPPPAQHDVYEEEEDYHDHEGVDTNDWHQPPSVSHPPPAHPHHSRYQAPAMFSPRADAGIGSNVPAPGFFSNTPDSSLAGLPVMSALQAGGAVRPSLVAGTGVPGSVATRFPMSMPQGVATTPTATVSHTAISSAGKPSASVVVTSVPDPIASTTPPTVVTASTPATNLLRSMAAQGTDVKVTQTSSVKPLPTFGSDSNAVVGNENKSLSTVGGFVFSGKPPVVEDKKVAPVITQASPVKPNPFSNFTFGAPTPAPVAAVTPASAVKTPVNHFTSPVKTPGTQYIAPAKSTTTKPGSATKSPTAKPGTVPSPGGADGADDHFEPNVDFKPIVELPEQVDLVTGEENEEKLFGERAKLFRQDAGQWKERGKGELKVMRDMTTGRCRIVMRRDQVLKLCANHTITKDMELKPLKSSENAVCWFAQDFSEEEVKRENLAAKFQTGEIMAKFRQVFEDCRQQMTNAAVKPVVKTSQDKQQSLGALFKAKPGQWECSTCLVKNEDNSTKCAACETPRPGAKQPVVKTATPSAAGASTISFGAGQGQNSKGQSLVDLFKVKPGQWECDMCLVKNEDGTTKCPACETPRPGFVQPVEKPATTAPSFGFASGGGFKFGGSATGGSPFAFGSPAANPPVTASVTKATDAAKPAASTISFGSKTQEAGAASFQFGSGSSVKFGAVGQSSVLAPANSAPVDLSIKPTAVTPAPAVKAAVIGTTRPSLGSGTFTFTPTKLDTGKSPSLACKSPQSPDGGFYVNSEGDDEHITFEPIVQLPEKVELMTGEEEEDVVYKERAKLLRFVGSEWKERGVGEVKLLRHRQTGKVRVVMRREKVHKLCLNHLISESIILKSMPNGKGKAWTWQAADFSESADSPSHETFAIRFMTEDAANLFKSAVDAAKSTESKPAVESDNQPSLLAKLLSSPAEDTDMDFAPVVQPTEVTDLKTGEEDEEMMFKSRAILYRFDVGSWKERGRGDIKILKDPSTGQSRVLMRHDQVLKVACNHKLTADMCLQPLATSETAWCWFATDYAENEAKNEQFAAKFKNKGTAAEFKVQFDACRTEGDASPVKGTVAANIVDKKGTTNEVVSSATSSIFVSVPTSVLATDESSLASTIPASVPTTQPATAPSSFNIPSTQNAGGLTATASTTQGPGLFGFDKSTPGPSLFTGEKTCPGAALLSSDTSSQGPGLFSIESDSKVPNTSSASSGFSFQNLASSTASQPAATSSVADFSFEPPQLGAQSVFGQAAQTVGAGDATADNAAADSDGSVVFSKRMTLSACCTDEDTLQVLGQGELELVFSVTGKPQLYVETEEGLVLCDHCVEPHHVATLDTKKKLVMWEACDENSMPPGDTRFSAQFSSKAAAEEFITCFNDAVEMSKQVVASKKSQDVENVGAHEADYDEVATNEAVSSAASSTSASVPTSVPATAVSSVASTTPASVPASQPAAAPFSFTLPSTQNAGGLTATASTTQGPGLFGFDKSKPCPSLFTGEKTCPGPALLSSQGPGLFSIQSDSKVHNASSASSGFSFKMPESKGPQGSGFSFQNLASSPASQPAATSGVAGFSFKPPQFGAQSVFGQAAQAVGADDATADNAAADSDGQEEYEAGEEDGSVVFSKRMTLSACGTDEDTLQVLGQGELELVFSETGKPQLYAETEEGLVLCDHCVEPHHVATLDKKKKLVMWEACDENSMPPGDTRFSAQFSSKAAAEEFITCFNDAVEMSKQVVASKKGQDVENVGAHEADYDDEDEDEEPLFTCQARLTLLTGNLIQEVGEGELCVVHDDDVPGCRILMESATGRKMVNHIVCRQHRLLSITDDTGTCAVQWSAKDFSSDEPVKQTFKITFKSESEMISFKEMFDQALKMSQEGQFDEL